ncbi:hypothetical protein RJT34_17507 [Clitoria ternatea]|uniref:3'-5' exonuclease domain-containing protein n=1 Tax=Clitoria ternatea TaxID=43366 RepID=A0AAN9PDC1_CLITE
MIELIHKHGMRAPFCKQHVDQYETVDVTFHSHTIQTLVTSDPFRVESWLCNVAREFVGRKLTVGLDVEWRPTFGSKSSNPVATLQLCLGCRCLVFQILHAPSIPDSLVTFLRDPNNTFMGVGIKDDVNKLLQDHSLVVSNSVELGSLAAEKLGDRGLKWFGLKDLGLRVLGLEVEKPKKVATSNWDNRRLSSEQVRYAAIDAFVSFEIGYHLGPPLDSLVRSFLGSHYCRPSEEKDNADSYSISKKRKRYDDDVGNSSSSHRNPGNTGSNLPIIESINHEKGGPRSSIYDLCKKLGWPRAEYSFQETRSRISYSYNCFVSDIILRIPNSNTLKCTGEPQPTKKSSFDSAAIAMLYELERQKRIVIAKKD